MEPSIYIDVLLMFEWCTDILLIWAAGILSGFPVKKKRIVLGAFASAVTHGLAVIFIQPYVGGVLFSLILLNLALATAYYPIRPQNYIRVFLFALGCSFLLGGGINVLLTLTDGQKLMGESVIISRLMPWQYVLWSIGISYVLLKLFGKWLERNIRRCADYCTVYIRKGEKWISARALLDTGNGLKRNGRGVIVMELSSLLPLFSKERQKELISGERAELESLDFSSLGNAHGSLWGFTAEECRISFGERLLSFKERYIGISFDDFTGSYEGLIPPFVLEEEEA